MATHSSILAWKIAWTEKPGGLQFMESQRVGHKHVCLHKITLMCEIKAADLRQRNFFSEVQTLKLEHLASKYLSSYLTC